jgi:tetratricopeptide (TPR) repeat protein
MGIPLAVAGAIGGIAVAGLLLALPSSEASAPCGDNLVDDVWSAPVRAAYAKQFSSVAPGRSAATIAFTDQALDQWAGAWRLGRRAACSAEPAERRARASCLDRQLVGLRAQLAVWMRADAAVVDRAAATASTLPSPDDCTAVVSTTAPTQDGALSEALAEIEALRRAGRYAEARTKTPAILDAANKLDPANKALAMLAVATIENELRENAAARTHIAIASQAARQSGDDRLLANTLSLDASIRVTSGNPAEALGLCDAVDALSPRGAMAAKLEAVRGEALAYLDRADDSVAAYQRGIAILEKEVARDPTHRLALAGAIGAAGSAMGRAGRPADGAVELKRALAIEESIVGADHPEVGRTLHDLGGLQRNLGAGAEAQRNYERARTIFVTSFGESALEVASCDLSLAYIAIDGGDFARSRELALRARDSLARTHADFGLLSSVETLLGNLEQDQDRCATAITHYEQALVAAKQAGETGRGLAISYSNLAGCLTDVGKRDGEARNALEASLAAWDAAGDAPERAQSLAIYADLEARGGRYRRAIELGEQALAAIKGLDGEPWQAIRDHVNDSLVIWRRRR